MLLLGQDLMANRTIDTTPRKRRCLCNVVVKTDWTVIIEGVSLANYTLHPIRGIESTMPVASPRTIHGRYVAWNYCEYLNPDRDSSRIASTGPSLLSGIVLARQKIIGQQILFCSRPYFAKTLTPNRRQRIFSKVRAWYSLPSSGRLSALRGGVKVKPCDLTTILRAGGMVPLGKMDGTHRRG